MCLKERLFPSSLNAHANAAHRDVNGVLVRRDDLFTDVWLKRSNICEGLPDTSNNLEGTNFSGGSNFLDDSTTNFVHILSRKSRVQVMAKGILHQRGGHRKPDHGPKGAEQVGHCARSIMTLLRMQYMEVGLTSCSDSLVLRTGVRYERD